MRQKRECECGHPPQEHVFGANCCAHYEAGEYCPCSRYEEPVTPKPVADFSFIGRTRRDLFRPDGAKRPTADLRG
jgi:hypothetical protein